MLTRKITLTLLFAIAILCVNAQTADEILAKYFENTGGLAKWKAIKTMKVEATAPTPQGELPIVIYSKAPNKTKVVVTVQGKEFIQAAYDGETAWNLNPFAGVDPVKLDDEQTKELKDQEMEDAFIDYKKKGHEVTLEGKEEIDGVQCFKVKLEKNKHNDKDDVTEYHYFDTENYVPIMRKSFVRSGPQKGEEVQSFMSDYQEVNGLMVPFAMEQKVKGNTVSKIVIVKYSINENIDDSVFAFTKK
jgi:outer membrane lipoprotein-sorting protein